MDDDIFMDLDVISAKKTYSNKFRKEAQLRRLSIKKKEADDIELPQPLTTKLAVKFLLEGRLKSKVCRYCLNITPGLSELDQVMKIGGTGNIYKVTVRDIVASFHPFKVVDDPNFPNKICQKCLDKALAAYLFTQQCERAERAMLNCFEDMYEKFEKLDPLERPKKRGRQKLNPNFNVLHAEHYKVINYAEPIINIVNVGAETLTKEPELNELECKKCWQVLPNLESLINHEKIHPKTMWYHCRLCGKSFPKCNQLKRHNNRVHILGKEPALPPEKDFKCKECSHVSDNFIQHLQHVEKHKFKNIMQHLIEKRMDKLCVVCHSKGTKMMELDKMVCLHGCHPDLMGDKTLYTLLATTLPTQKSYKYQDLCLPSKAHIMTISSKKKTQGKRKTNEWNSLMHNDNILEDFQFSQPIIVDRHRFKTDHFYCYVFCDPDNQNDPYLENYKDMNDRTDLGKQNVFTDTVIRNNDYVINKIKTKIIEIVDICEIENDDLDIEMDMDTEINGTTEADEDITEYPVTGIPDLVNKKDDIIEITDEIQKKDELIEMDGIDSNLKTEKFYFSSPKLLVNDVKVINTLANVSPYIFSNPMHGGIKAFLGSKRVKVAAIDDGSYLYESPNPKYMGDKNMDETIAHETNKKDNALTDEKPAKSVDKNGSIYVKQFENSNAINNATKSDEMKVRNIKCNFCWIFKHIGVCENCNKPMKDKIEEKLTEEINVEKREDNIKEMFEKKKIWECNVCLINNNSERITCTCCGSMRHTEHSDIKIKFGINNIPLQNKDIKDYNNSIPKENNENKNFDNTLVTEEATKMVFKTNIEENNNQEMDKNHAMDIEMFDTSSKDIEKMDFEESPIITNEFHYPIFNYNIETVPNTNPTVINAVIGTNMQFNMGYTSNIGQKFSRRVKRAIRNIPKAFHK